MATACVVLLAACGQGCRNHTVAPAAEPPAPEPVVAESAPASTVRGGLTACDGVLGLHWGASEEEGKKILSQTLKPMGGIDSPTGESRNQWYQGLFYGHKAHITAMFDKKLGFQLFEADLPPPDERPATRRWLDLAAETTEIYGAPLEMNQPPPPWDHDPPFAQDMTIVKGDWKPSAGWHLPDCAIAIDVEVGEPNSWGHRELTPRWIAMSEYAFTHDK